ncbi:MAG: M1 family aminopeptidase [Candidatus Zixiibacteriota bacterium]
MIHKYYLNASVMPAIRAIVLFFAFLTPGAFAEQPVLPGPEELLRQSRLAHEACRQGKSQSLQKWIPGAEDSQRGGSPQQEKYDVTYYLLDLKFDRQNALLIGDVAMTAEVTDTLSVCEIDCRIMMTVDSVKLNGESALFTRTPEVVSVDLGRTHQTGEKFTVNTYYHAVESDLTPWALRFGIMGGKPAIGNLSECWWARTWWPCKDQPNDKADSLDFFITYPANQFCTSNGNLISDVDNEDGFRTTHWSVRYPIATYLVSVAIAEFEHWREWAHPTDTDSLPVDYWVCPYLLEEAQQTYAITVPAIDSLSRIIGTYPFMNEKYAMSSFPWEGTAMENQTNTSMSPAQTNQMMTVVHELAHQWWGDMITNRDWHHCWLNEGFATYSEALFIESLLGSEGLHDYMKGIEFLRDGTIYRYDTLDLWSTLDVIVYKKGAWALHMLRGIIGDQDFFDGLRAYADSPLKYGTAVTEDFQFYMEQASGRDLDWFFQEWIYRSGFPRYEFSWQCQPALNGSYQLYLLVEQVQEDYGLFQMPVQMQYVIGNDTLDDTVWVANGFELIQIEFADSVSEVIFDPHNWILKTVVENPLEMTIISRYPPNGEVNSPYEYQMQALGGIEPYTWSFLGGDLPYGVDFIGGNDGLVTGVPTYAATYYFTVGLTDSDSPPNQRTFSLSVTIDKALLVGDCSGNGRIDIADAVFLINYIFAGGPEPSPLVLGDVDCNAMITISDAVFLVNYLYSAGPAPCQ